MKQAPIYRFAGFSLDVRERRLTRSGEPVPLRAKVFDTLVILVQNAGRLLTKEELLAALWPDAVVEENNLNHNISVLRKALKEGTGQQFIETVPRTGYRFVAEVESTAAAAVPVATPAMVAREAECAELQGLFAAAAGGQRHTVFITGQAGLGKTTLVNTFLSSLDPREYWLLNGQCVEHRGEVEPYLPIFEAFARLSRTPDAAAVMETMATHAPSWLVQMPALVSAEKRAALQGQIMGVTRERMLREMVEAIEALARLKPLVVVGEDLHWSDASTLDLLSRLARRHDPARLLVIVSLRPAAAEAKAETLYALVQELKLRYGARELALSLLDSGAVEKVVSRRYNGAHLPEGIASLLHQRTEGNPLFVHALLDHWQALGLLCERDGAVAMPGGLEQLSGAVPETLRELVREQLAALDQAHCEIIEAAAVAGVEFSSALLAEAVRATPEETERRCVELARRGHFLRAAADTELPDGTLSAGFAFLHSLYQEIVYTTIPSGRRVRLHQEIGDRLERSYAGDPTEVAAALAMHFVEARDVHRALRYLHLAAVNAIRRNAYAEAIAQLTRGLKNVSRLAETDDRERWELTFQATLGPALVAVRGWADSDAERAYKRALDLSHKLGDHDRRDRMTFGLAAMHELRGQYQQTEALLSGHLQKTSGGSVALESHELLACSLFHQGIFQQALEHADRGAALRVEKPHSELSATFGENPGIGCSTWAALSLWFLGYPDQALARAQDAIRLADQPSNKYGLASVYAQAAIVHQLRREPEQVLRSADVAVELGERFGFAYRKAIGEVLGGWALALLGDAKHGVWRLQQGLVGCTEQGVTLDKPYYLALLAEAVAAGGDRNAALDAVEEAFALIAPLRSFFYAAELYRLRAVFRAGQAPSSTRDDLRKAITLAQAQSARGIELRAACDLARLSRQQGWQDDGFENLKTIAASFHEGHDTADLQAALELLGPRRSRQRAARG